MKPMIATTDDFVFAYMRLTHAAKPYFARMARKPISRLEDRFPKTVSLLFEAALNYVKSHQKDPLPESIESSAIINLLQLETKKHNLGIPEVFDNEGIKSNISELELESLCQLFYDYVVNLLTPSYATVELLLQNDKIEMAEDVSSKLAHSYDKSKSLSMIIRYFLAQKNIEKAITYFSLIPSSFDRRDVVSKIVLSLLKEQQLDKAIKFSKDLTDSNLKEHALHEMTLGLTKMDKLPNALAVLNEISEESDIKSYTLSLIIAILTSQGKFIEASKLSHLIKDKDYQVDAINDIVKKMIRVRPMREAEEFVSQLEGTVEKKEADKILESGMKVRLQDERIKKLQIF